MVMPSVATSVTSQMPPLVLSSKRLSESLIVAPTRRRVLDQDERLRIVRTTTAQYGCWRIGIPPEDEFGEILSGRDGAQPPLLKSLARVHLALLEFRLVACQIRVEARKSDLHERSGAIRPLEFAVEVLLHLCGRDSCLLAGFQFNLTRQERIVVADTHITVRQPLEAKDA